MGTLSARWGYFKMVLLYHCVPYSTFCRKAPKKERGNRDWWNKIENAFRNNFRQIMTTYIWPSTYSQLPKCVLNFLKLFHLRLYYQTSSFLLYSTLSISPKVICKSATSNSVSCNNWQDQNQKWECKWHHSLSNNTFTSSLTKLPKTCLEYLENRKVRVRLTFCFLRES